MPGRPLNNWPLRAAPYANQEYMVLRLSDFTDYREILKAELTRRRVHNPSYSQRAFARDLKVRSNRLNEIMLGKQGISPQLAVHVAAVLGYGGSAAKYFCDLVTSKHARSKDQRELAKKDIASYIEQQRREGFTSTTELLLRHPSVDLFPDAMFTVKKEKIPEALSELENFRRRFTKDFKETDCGGDVFCFSIQFFRLTR